MTSIKIMGNIFLFCSIKSSVSTRPTRKEKWEIPSQGIFSIVFVFNRLMSSFTQINLNIDHQMNRSNDLIISRWRFSWELMNHLRSFLSFNVLISSIFFWVLFKLTAMMIIGSISLFSALSFFLLFLLSFFFFHSQEFLSSLHSLI